MNSSVLFAEHFLQLDPLAWRRAKQTHHFASLPEPTRRRLQAARRRVRNRDSQRIKYYVVRDELKQAARRTCDLEKTRDELLKERRMLRESLVQVMEKILLDHYDVGTTPPVTCNVPPSAQWVLIQAQSQAFLPPRPQFRATVRTALRAHYFSTGY